ncbi:arginine deiminase-related protein [Marinicella meishanensis]|uniref:arginine deiminase-related protein n=1 Tax=Marinicella meishanensis TaxID=2873263 RepID=UPI001CBEFA0A|nr:arginine deiminase-related protein [Marinicella sp. NBU2979]
MLVKTVEEFKAAVVNQPFPIKQAGSMKAAFMVSPIGFRLDQQTAQDNEYMLMDQAVDVQLAMYQHQHLARAITDVGVPVVTFPGSADTPDAVFPNNAFATTHHNRYVIGSMKYDNRQKETERADIRQFFGELLGYEKYEIDHAKAVAELTGVLVPDRARNIGFVGMTERVDDAGVVALDEAFATDLMFQFDLAPGEYHTNVVMACLAGHACVMHRDSFADPAVVDAIAEFYQDRTLLITDEEKLAFVGNCISITERDVFFSQTALDALRPESKQTLESWGFVLHGVDVSELEKAGGSLRCMIGEIF